MTIKRGGGGKGTRAAKAGRRRSHIIREARRDHAARRRDMDRGTLAADVEAYLAAGGEIEEVEGYRQAPARSPVRAWERVV